MTSTVKRLREAIAEAGRDARSDPARASAEIRALSRALLRFSNALDAAAGLVPRAREAVDRAVEDSRRRVVA